MGGREKEGQNTEIERETEKEKKEEVGGEREKKRKEGEENGWNKMCGVNETKQAHCFSKN